MIDCGRWPAKRVIGDTVEVSADVWRDGHDLLRADVRVKGPGDRQWSRAPMHRVDAHEDGDRWADELARKVAGGQEELHSELLEGIHLLERAAAQTKDKQDKRLIEHAIEQL